MADQNPSQHTESKAQGHESTVHVYDAPNISAKEFLLRVMHAPDVPIKDRIRAASTLLRIYPHDWDPPRLKYIIGGIPSEALGPFQPRPMIESTENHSHFSAVAHKAPSPMMEKPGSPNIETIIEDIRSGNHPQPTLCTICGHYMPYPCSTSKTPIN